MGCLPVLLIISLIVGFILYAIGAFNGGVDKVVPNVMNFLGRGSSAFSSAENRAVASQAPSSEDSQTAAPSPAAPLLSENFDDVGAAVQETAAMQPAQAPVRAAPQPLEEESGLSRLLNSLTGGGEPAAPAEAFNPNNYPAVYGVTRVINGDTLEMRGRYIKIYGIDAPAWPDRRTVAPRTPRDRHGLARVRGAIGRTGGRRRGKGRRGGRK